MYMLFWNTMKYHKYKASRSCIFFNHNGKYLDDGHNYSPPSHGIEAGNSFGGQQEHLFATGQRFQAETFERGHQCGLLRDGYCCCGTDSTASSRWDWRWTAYWNLCPIWRLYRCPWATRETKAASRAECKLLPLGCCLSPPLNTLVFRIPTSQILWAGTIIWGCVPRSCRAVDTVVLGRWSQYSVCIWTNREWQDVHCIRTSKIGSRRSHERHHPWTQRDPHMCLRAGRE